MFLPATGVVSMVIATFARRPVAGYILVAMAIVVTGFLSFGLWVHHMFATGLPSLSAAFFTAASLMISVASATQVFAWIATLWGSRPEFKTPFLFLLGFFFVFVLGGFTGVMVAVVPFDLQVHDTYFIVAHFHYVLIGGVVFPIYAGLHYWIPKITGRMLSESLGKLSFVLTFTGFNLAFFPMHIMGMLGMPRRVYTYSEELGLGGHNLLASIGSFILAAGFFLLVLNFFYSLRKGKAPPAIPGGLTLSSGRSPLPLRLIHSIPCQSYLPGIRFGISRRSLRKLTSAPKLRSPGRLPIGGQPWSLTQRMESHRRFNGCRARHISHFTRPWGCSFCSWGCWRSSSWLPLRARSSQSAALSAGSVSSPRVRSAPNRLSWRGSQGCRWFLPVPAPPHGGEPYACWPCWQPGSERSSFPISILSSIPRNGPRRTSLFFRPGAEPYSFSLWHSPSYPNF
jgi:hypothetical protein